MTHPNHILLGDALRNHHHQPDLSINGLIDGTSCVLWRDIDDGGIRSCFFLRLGKTEARIEARFNFTRLQAREGAYLLNSVEHWKTKVGLASFPWRHTAHHPGPILLGQPGVGGTLGVEPEGEGGGASRGSHNASIDLQPHGLSDCSVTWFPVIP